MRRFVVVAGGLLGVVVACAQGDGSPYGADLGDGNPDAGPGTVDAGPSTQPAEAGGGGVDAQQPQYDAQPPKGDSAPDVVADACSTALAAARFDFESGDQGWTHGTSDGITVPPALAWPYDPWKHGTATAGAACPSGQCFGTELTQNYAECQRGFILSPTIDLSACSAKNIVLTFRHAYSFWQSGSQGDGGVIEVSGDDGATWTPLAGSAFSGTVNLRMKTPTDSYECANTSYEANNRAGFVGQGALSQVEVALPAAALTAKLRVRFAFASGQIAETADPDTSRQSAQFGWRIDDVAFSSK